MDESAVSESASQAIVSNAVPSSPRSSRGAQHQKSLSTSHNTIKTGGEFTPSHKVWLPTKPRALTLDDSGRLILPPLSGHHSPSRFGPLRSSPLGSFPSTRHKAEFRHNPYFVSTPARRSSEQLALSSLRRDAHDVALWSSARIPRTPTSSIRSTSEQDDSAEVASSSYFSSRASLLTPPRSTSGQYLDSPSKTGTADSVRTFEANASHLPSSHLALPGNALGLFLEPAPFPAELMQFDDHGGSTPRRLSLRSEADFYLGQHGGGSTNFLDSPKKGGSRVLTRSPMAMSETSSITISPTSSDDSLPAFPLAHRHNLNATSNNSTLALPALKHDDLAKPAHASPAKTTQLSKSSSDSYLYSMPVLRAMSPFADMTSDSEEEESEEPLAGPSMSARTTALHRDTPEGRHQTAESDVPQEGRTGEIFAEFKSILPLATKVGRHDASTKLFCKLDSTSHHCFSVVDGKWACYRRNYLKIDVSFHLEDEQGRRRDALQGDVICAPAGRPAFVVERFAVHMTAHVINEDGRLQRGRQGLVPLIQFGPARERGPREPVQPVELRSGGRLAKDASANEQAAVRTGTIAAFRRVQIRSATMNNGQRGAASQQFYALKLTLLAYPKQGPLSVAAGVEVASLTSHPITVRGRSKVHYAPAAEVGSSKKKSGGTGAVSRSTSGLPSANTNRVRSAGTSNRPNQKRDHATHTGWTSSHRRSTRLLLAADNAPNHDVDMVQDADDEYEDKEEAQVASRSVMDIRSII
ncbi:NDT80 DNA-binding domain protein [Kalmanozyma brasiliensis GHG001]|uniref:NDT80 DNA-binding domain protein n=1 Tax=Kalmanozyma brasiliensis (strain GHG001) TaxID=1365824 RepID=UPI0028683316|nr:NDT80 DNA-binding domain protein [Kalmanozyma brasiliensis GHG001]EST05419.2 NDT80 DNA-binding domain protein [Kalmanozyma brasiliensis GHG001]